MKYTLLISFFLIAFRCYSTDPSPDRIVFKGVTSALHAFPLEKYFESHPEKRPKIGLKNTAYKRGYCATYEVLNDTLYLIDMLVYLKNENDTSIYSKPKLTSIIDLLSPELKNMKIDWFSGIATVFDVNFKDSFYRKYNTNYENYTVISIKCGNIEYVGSLSQKEYLKFRHKQFLAFKKSKQYLIEKEKLLTEDFLQNEIDKVIEEATYDYLITPIL